MNDLLFEADDLQGGKVFCLFLKRLEIGFWIPCFNNVIIVVPSHLLCRNVQGAGVVQSLPFLSIPLCTFGWDACLYSDSLKWNVTHIASLLQLKWGLLSFLISYLESLDHHDWVSLMLQELWQTYQLSGSHFSACSSQAPRIIYPCNSNLPKPV